MPDKTESDYILADKLDRARMEIDLEVRKVTRRAKGKVAEKIRREHALSLTTKGPKAIEKVETKIVYEQ